MRLHLPIAVALMAAACGPAGNTNSPSHPTALEQWTSRASASYRSGDFEDARESAGHALSASANDPAARILGARIALAELDYREAIHLLEGIETTEARRLRGRARWYVGDLEAAAEDLSAALDDPALKDPWAREVTKLARLGNGRHPFQMEGASIASVEMPSTVEQAVLGGAHVIRCELEGSSVFALVATGMSEVIIDSASRHEPAWVNLRFNDSSIRDAAIEVKDVPALTQDLSPFSRRLGGVPIHMLIGASLLRHLHVTFDRRGGQFVVRREDPLAPPEASRVPLFYPLGAGMVLRARPGKAERAEVPMLVDTSEFFPMALGDLAWKQSNVDPASLVQISESPPIRRGLFPSFTLGGFELSEQPALEGVDLSERPASAEVALGGVIGAELLAYFRVTIANEGRFAWVEGDPEFLQRRKPAKGDAPKPPAAEAPPPPPAASSAPPPAGSARTGGTHP